MSVVKKENNNLSNKIKGIGLFIVDHPIIMSSIALISVSIISVCGGYNFSGNIIKGDFSLTKS